MQESLYLQTLLIHLPIDVYVSKHHKLMSVIKESAWPDAFPDLLIAVFLLCPHNRKRRKRREEEWGGRKGEKEREKVSCLSQEQKQTSFGRLPS